jgi:hypothetical protein
MLNRCFGKPQQVALGARAADLRSCHDFFGWLALGQSDLGTTTEMVSLPAAQVVFPTWAFSVTSK